MYRKLIEQLGKRSGDAILPVQIAYFTGLRLGEVAGLTWQDINLEEQYLTVRRSIRYNGATSINEIYGLCQKSEQKYACVPLVKKTVIREYAKMKFQITKKVFDPVFEKKANERIFDHVAKSIDAGIVLRRVRYKELNLSDILNEDKDL